MGKISQVYCRHSAWSYVMINGIRYRVCDACGQSWRVGGA